MNFSKNKIWLITREGKDSKWKKKLRRCVRKVSFGGGQKLVGNASRTLWTLHASAGAMDAKQSLHN